MKEGRIGQLIMLEILPCRDAGMKYLYPNTMIEARVVRVIIMFGIQPHHCRSDHNFAFTILQGMMHINGWIKIHKSTLMLSVIVGLRLK